MKGKAMNTRPTLRVCDDVPDLQMTLTMTLASILDQYRDLAQMLLVLGDSEDRKNLTRDLLAAARFTEAMLSSLRHPAGGR